MSAGNLARDAAKNINRHTPLVLAIIGSVGVAATAYLAHQAGFKAANAIRDAEESRGEKITDPKEKINLTWKFYAAPASTGVATVACVITGNIISTKRQTALLGAYALGERAFAQYKGKIVDTLGLEQEKEIVEQLAEENAKEDAAEAYSRKDLVPEINGNKALFIDHLSGQEFIADLNDVYMAKEQTNLKAAEDGYASMNYFYGIVGGRRTELYENMGWNPDRMMDLIITRVNHDDEETMPIYGLDFYERPLLEHQRVI